jgi:hypothetical protein
VAVVSIPIAPLPKSRNDERRRLPAREHKENIRGDCQAARSHDQQSNECAAYELRALLPPDRFRDCLTRLIEVLARIEPRIIDDLFPGADDAAIQRLRAELAMPPPAEMEALYGTNNGEGRLDVDYVSSVDCSGYERSAPTFTRERRHAIGFCCSARRIQLE